MFWSIALTLFTAWINWECGYHFGFKAGARRKPNAARQAKTYWRYGQRSYIEYTDGSIEEITR